jgi:DUF1365 family protein
LLMLIDSVREGNKELKTSVIWKRMEITNKNMLYLIGRYPFLTVLIIGYIHWQACKLWVQKVTLYTKDTTDKRIVEALQKKES